jgi:hypothetical protein
MANNPMQVEAVAPLPDCRSTRFRSVSVFYKVYSQMTSKNLPSHSAAPSYKSTKTDTSFALLKIWHAGVTKVPKSHLSSCRPDLGVHFAPRLCFSGRKPADIGLGTLCA